MKLRLRHIRCFISVAEELHFRRAAEKLGIAQPALSRTIKDLESELGLTLFERTNRSVQITRAGSAFLHGCRAVINAMDRAVDTARRVDQGQIGSLRIGYTDAAIANVLPGIVKSFQRRQPDIALQLNHEVTVSQLRKLEEGELDVCFATGPFNHADYRQLLVCSEPFVCVTHGDHPLARRSGIRLAELAGENFVHGAPKEWEIFYSCLIPLCRRAGFVPRIVQQGRTTADILGLVSCAMGVTILTASMCEVYGSGLAMIPLDDVEEMLQTVAIWQASSNHPPKQHFLDHLLDSLDIAQSEPA